MDNQKPNTETKGRDKSELHELPCSAGYCVACEIECYDEKWIGVGMSLTRKAIALCGKVGAVDEKQSWSDAKRIAKLWNEAEN